MAFVLEPEFPGSRLCGVTRWLAEDRALIQLSLRYKAHDRLWFTFFHEACHVVRHGKRRVFIEEELRSGAKRPAEEAEADRFAADILIPRADY